MKLYAGTSGFAYKEWKGRFYPETISSKEMLPFYAHHFNTVEINNTFYRMPSPGLLEGWAAQVPEDFRFAIKAPRKITHFKRLKGVEEETRYLISTVSALGGRLGPVLYQFPPDFHRDLPLLEAFLDLLSGTLAAFEFRHASWLNSETFELLRKSRCGLCVSDTEPDSSAEIVATAPFGYLRLRRPDYSGADLASWRARIVSQEWDSAYVFFKHESEAAGPQMAERFTRDG